MLRIFRAFWIILPCLSAFVLSSPVRGAVIHVPGDQPTIQAGVDASVDGDTIQLAGYGFDGPGNVDVVLNNRSVSIIGAGPEETFIIGQYVSRGFVAYMTDQKPILIEGMTILRCHAEGDGGGIYCVNGSPTLRNLVIAGCSASNDGGGIAGKWCASLVVEDVTVSGCHADGYGGGIALDDMVAPVLDAVEIVDCYTDYGGAGLYCRDIAAGTAADLVLNNNRVMSGRGGGIYFLESEMTCDGGFISGNYAANGGGVDVGYGCDVAMAGFTVVANKRGGIFCGGETETRFVFANGVIAFNENLGGIYGSSLADIQVIDSTIYGHYGPEVQGGMADPFGLNGVVNADPRFCDRTAGDYTVSDRSPCLPENNDHGVLMGCFGQGCEEPRNVHHVPGDCGNIQFAVDVSVDGDSIIIAPGVYTGWGNRDIVIADKEVHIVGGGSEATIIDCEGEGQGFRVEGSDGWRPFTLRGVTIRNGHAADGGGGLYLEQVSPTLEDVRILDCVSDGYCGGALIGHCNEGDISDLTILDCVANSYGGLSLTSGCDHRITNLRVERCESSTKAAITLGGYDTAVTNGLISGNTTAAGWETIRLEGSVVASGMTLVGNSSPVIKMWDWSHLDLGLSVIAFNHGDAPALMIEPYNNYATLETACCDLFGNEGGDFGGLMTDPIGVNGNIAEDPLFCGPAMEDFHLAADSPCLPDNNSCGVLMGMFGQGCGPTAVATPGAPATDYLAANHPNPFNPTTKIAFGLKEPAEVTLRIYDAGGRLVRTLLDGETRDAGRHEATWTGRDDAGIRLSSGVYFYRLEAGAFTDTRKMTLLK